jgi:ABC-type molybdate transport system permease subunit
MENSVRISASVVSHIGMVCEKNKDNFFINGRFMYEHDTNNVQVSLESSASTYLFAVCDNMERRSEDEITPISLTKELRKFYERARTSQKDIYYEFEKLYESVYETSNVIYSMDLIKSENKIDEGGAAALFISGNKAAVLDTAGCRSYLLRDGKLSSSTLWLFMFQDNFGLINDVLKKLGVINQNIAWTSSVRWALFAAVISETWRYTPFFVIIFSAALQSISKDYYEAAKIDGANALRRFTSITIPFLKETVTFSCILRVVWEFNNVDVIYTLTKGGPMNETTTLAMYLVKTAIQGSDMGYGSALTVVSFILLAVFSLLLIKIGGVSKESVI